MMQTVLEFLAVLCLDLAMIVFITELARGRASNLANARMVAVTMAIGFLLGTAAKCVTDTVLLLIPDALGFMLSYTAVLFTFPARKCEKCRAASKEKNQ